MHRFKAIHLFFLFLCCSSYVKCEARLSHKTTVKRNVDANLQCNQYADDLDILSGFPFPVSLDYRQQGPTKSTAIMDSKNSSVVMIQLRQVGGIVPESVFCLKELQALNIMNMFFVDGIVPDALSNLQKLHTLSITNTPITKMTVKLGTLQNLQSLSLTNCALTSLPNLSGLYNLSNVFLLNNRLSELEGLVQVSSLLLQKNRFTKIPTIEVPEALRSLDMNYNPIPDMSAITSFGNLSTIRLAQTEISIIPPEIDELKSLSTLDLSNTRITHIPRAILKLPRLQYLVVQNNPFSQEEKDAIKMELIKQQSKTILLI